MRAKKLQNKMSFKWKKSNHLSIENVSGSLDFKILSLREKHG